MDSMQRKKSATISIEFVMGIFASLAVMFIALGIFSTNLFTMANSSGIRNMFRSNNTSSKTVFQSSSNSFASTTVNVETAGANGTLNGSSQGSITNGSGSSSSNSNTDSSSSSSSSSGNWCNSSAEARAICDENSRNNTYSSSQVSSVTSSN